MSASFILCGNLPSVIDLLKIILSGSTTAQLICFSRILLILSKPALFLFGRLQIILFISPGEVGVRNREMLLLGI